MLSGRCPVLPVLRLSVCNVGVLLPSGCMDQNEAWHGGRLGPGHIALDWDPTELPSSKRGRSPQFSTHICCGEMAGWIKMPLGKEVGLSLSDIVLDGDPATPPPKGAEPQFSSHVYCGQTARWIKMALGTQVGLGSAQRRSVRWGAPRLYKRCSAPVFGPCLL